MFFSDKNIGITILIVILGVTVFDAGAFAFAQSEEAQVAQRRAQLQRELSELEEEIEAQRDIVDSKRQENVSLQRDIDILNAQIKKAQLSIRARDVSIARLSDDIGGKALEIDELTLKMEREKKSLAQILRKTRELDDTTFVEIVLGNRSFSDIFSDLDSFATLEEALQDSFREIEGTKKITQREKSSLENTRTQEQELRQIQQLEKQTIENREDEKQEILKVSKGVERVYQQVLQDKEKTAAQIRAELFTLRDAAAIPFEQALAFANQASEKTGVRPAFILGVIAQESNLGENVGQCLLTNEPSKGDGKGVNTGRLFRRVMKPTRDVDPFIAVTRSLGINPFGQVVSCPPSYGFGGAMGPAQFIASTWILYAGYDAKNDYKYNRSKDRIGKLSGNHPPNPWNPEDVFVASALLLSDNGADRGTRAAERLAALRYFAGWTNARNPRYAFYGEQVMELADFYQKNIDILNRS